MLKLRHQYNSASPYESCGYERVPAYPGAGEPVTILCRTEPHDARSQLRLVWTADGRQMPPAAGKFRHVDGEGRGYYEFSLPPLPDASIEYRMEAVLSEETIMSEQFHLEPLRPAAVPEFTGAWQWEGGFGFGLCAGEEFFLWSWKAGEGCLHGQLSPEKGLPAGAVPMKRQERFEPLPGITAEFHRTPFCFALSGQNGELLRLEGKDIRLRLDSSGGLWELRVRLSLAAAAVFGLGERFNSVNQLGRNVVVSSYEKFTDQGERSYLPIPFFMTDRGVGLLHESSLESRYAFQPREFGSAAAELCFSCAGECRDTLLFGPPAEQVRRYGALTGGAVLPPRWAFGPWMSSNRWETQAQAEEQLAAMEQYGVPATVFVLERWSDDTTFDCFEDVPHPLIESRDALRCAGFRFSESPRWPDPVEMTERIHALGMKLILWQAPILRRPPDASEQCRRDYEYAVQQRYCVMQPDGNPFTCPEGWFTGSLLIDFTNPEAVRWWNRKREWLLDELHADGFKTDSGELVTDDRSLFANGKTGREMRNLYPMAYEEAYAKLLREHNPEGVNFTRAGYTGAQKYPIHWTGDQRSTFAELRAQVRAALSAGLSGVLFVGTDLAGFAGEPPTDELYRRGVSLAAFSGLMQFHSEPTGDANNDRSPWNMALLRNDAGLIRHYRRYANLRMSLLPYLYSEAVYGSGTFRPLMAHYAFDYPDDPASLRQEDAYLLGRSLLVAPVLESGSTGRNIYFPAGEWVSLSSGTVQPAGERFVPCARDEIPVYLRKGKILPLALSPSFGFGGWDDLCGDELCFLFAGDGTASYLESPGRGIHMELSNGELEITGCCPENPVFLALMGELPRSARINGTDCELEPVTGSCYGRTVLGVRIHEKL